MMSIEEVNRASGSIDWDEMRDRYTIKIMDDLRNSEQRETTDLDINEKRETSEGDQRRRLSFNGSDRETPDDSRSIIVRVQKKKKKKKKKVYSPNGLYSKSKGKSKKSKGKSKISKGKSKISKGKSQKSKGKSQKSKGKSQKSKGKYAKKYYKSGKYVQFNVEGQCFDLYSKYSSTKYSMAAYGRERDLRNSFGMTGYFKGKKMKVKKKGKGKGGKGKGSTRVTRSPSDSDSPSVSNSPSSYYRKKSKKKKKKKKTKFNLYDYPYCDDLLPTISPAPSLAPTVQVDPKEDPTPSPSKAPTRAPTVTKKPPTPDSPTKSPSKSPTKSPSKSPTKSPSKSPTKSPTKKPTANPTLLDRTEAPSISPAPTLEKGIYRYDSGNCPKPGSTGVPCAENTDIRKICDRYNEKGSFKKCWDICKPSFCCIHDANPATNPIAPSCSNDENCAQYAYCYIVWFKFHDTFGPATYLNVKQEGEFFDLPNSDVRDGDDEFFDQLYFHHFDNIQPIVEQATVGGEIDLSLIFENELYWDIETR
jgi:hypothetical protein